MKLYYFKNACSLAVRIVANALEIPLEYEAITQLQVKEKTTESGVLLSTISPKNQVPVLVLEGGEILTEVSAILIYLWEMKKTLESPQKYRVLEWLSFCTSELHKNFVPIISPIIPAEAKPVFTKLFLHKLKYVESYLKNRNYLVGDEFSPADSYLFTILSWLFIIKIPMSDFPEIDRFFQGLTRLPFVAKSLTEENIKIS